jgi:hypothetical protein
MMLDKSLAFYCGNLDLRSLWSLPVFIVNSSFVGFDLDILMVNGGVL